MKIAALYDIHGNLPALNAVLTELSEIQPDLIVVGGDIVSGPLPAQTLQRLLQVGERVRFLSGNNDREVVTVFDDQPVVRRYLPAMSEQGREEARRVAGQLARAERDFLAALPERLVFHIAEIGEILFCHATPRHDEEIFTPITPEERLNAIFSEVEQDMVVCGHTHMQFERRAGKVRILNAGSVGMPFADQPGAYWLLLDPTGCEFRRTAYDSEAAAQEIVQSSDNASTRAFVKDNVLTIPSAAYMADSLEKLTAIYQ